MWIVEGKTFDKYYKAYEYASELSTKENKEVEVLKQGSDKGVKVWTNRPMVNDY
jgi:hypothetical protein